MSQAFDTLRFGARMLRKAPGATLTVLVALSFGIGLPTLMFSLVMGAIVPTLPFPNGDRIVRISRVGDAPVTTADFEYLSTRQRSFDGLGAVSSTQVTLGLEGQGAESLSGALIDPALLNLLSVNPARGRAFTAADASADAPAVVLLGHDVWQDRLAGDPDVLGRIVRVNGRETEVVGVMPEGFGFPFDDQIWLPLRVDPLRYVLARSGEQDGSIAFLVGRLREGVSRTAASEDLSALLAQVDLERGLALSTSSRAQVVAYTNIFSSEGQRFGIAGMMLGVALLVLLVACANVTNVLLARTVARSREVAIRTAMGASRPRIALQFLSEAALLALLGGAGGALLATIGTSLINDGIGSAPGAPFWIDFRVDLPVLVFVALMSGLTAVAAGLIPALQASRTDPHDLMRDGARGSSGFRMGRVMRRFVTVELALSFVLLVGAGLFIRSAANMDRTEFAFDPEQVYEARMQVSETHPTPEARAAFLVEAREALAAIPETQNVALASDVPGIGSAALVTVEVEDAAAGSESPRARRVAVTPGYFDLFRASMLAGRDFTDADRLGAPPVALVNEPFQRIHFPGGAVGRRVRVTAGTDAPTEWHTVVGVVPGLMVGGIEREVEGAVYVPIGQLVPPGVVVLARPRTEFATLPGPVRQALSRLDPDVPLMFARSLRASIDAANAQFFWVSVLFLTAGGIALFLAALGLYGVMAFWVAQRTREIGVRMALGGERRRVVGLVLRQGMTQTGWGLIAGLALAIPVARAFGSVLFGVAWYDPIVFGSILAILTVAAWLGCWIPARRATRIDPLEALAQD
ncbi:MAG: ADOP family duplicated permease [Longimicrobiales bacterium]